MGDTSADAKPKVIAYAEVGRCELNFVSYAESGATTFDFNALHFSLTVCLSTLPNMEEDDALFVLFRGVDREDNENGTIYFLAGYITAILEQALERGYPKVWHRIAYKAREDDRAELKVVLSLNREDLLAELKEQ